MASICLKKFRGGVDAQRKIKEKRMEEAAAAEAAAVASSKARRVGEEEGPENVQFSTITAQAAKQFSNKVAGVWTAEKRLDW